MQSFPHIKQDYILQQIYKVTDVAEHFTYAHHHSDVGAALYDALDTRQLEDANFEKSLDKTPHAHPYGLIFYRQVFHQELASNDDFLEALKRKNINNEHYFRDIEKVVRVCFYELVQECSLGNEVSYAEGYKAAVAHAALFSRLYFRSVSIAATVVRMIDGEASDDEWMERLHAALWAMDLAGIYTGALLDINFRAAQLVSTDMGLYQCPYSTEQVNIIFESGFHLARHITTQILPDVESLGVTRSQLTRLLSDELEDMGQLQRSQGLVDNIQDIESIGVLVRHAVEEYEPELMNNLTLKCAEFRLSQERANIAMQQALARKPKSWFRRTTEDAATDASPEAMQPASDNSPPHTKEADSAAPTTSSAPNSRTDSEARAKLRDKEVEKEQKTITEASPQEAPAPKVADEQRKQASAIMSGLAAMTDQMGEQTNKTVIAEGKRIIDYLKRIQFGDSNKHEEMGVTTAQKDTDDSGGSSSSSESQDNDVPDLEELMFEVRIDGEEKKKRTLREIVVALRSGHNVTFASQAQVKTFMKATMQLMKHQQLGFSVSQLKYMQRGMITSAHEELFAEMADAMQLQMQMLKTKRKHTDQAQNLDQHTDQQSYSHKMDDAHHINSQNKATDHVKDAPETHEVKR